MKRLLILCLFWCQIVLAAPVNIAGFEQGSIDTNSDCRTTSGTITVSSTSKHTGAYSLRSNPTTTASGSCRMSKNSAAGLSTTELNIASGWVRFYFCAATLPASAEEKFISALDTGASDKAFFTITSAGKIKAYNNAGTLDATGSATISAADCTVAANWTLIEIRTSTGAGSTAYEVKVAGASDISDTMDQLTNNLGSYRFGKVTDLNGNSVNFFYDDIQINDSAYPGDGAVGVMHIDSNGSTMSWTAGDAACNATNANCYLEVDDIPTDDDTTYVQNTTNSTALFNFESSSSANISGTINAVKGWARFKESVDGSAATAVRIRAGGSNVDTTNNNVGTSYVNRYNFSLVDPSDSAAWTTGDLDGIECGAVEATASQVDRLTSVGMQVDYVPGTATATPTPTNTPTNTPTATPTATATPTPTPATLKLLPLMDVGQ